MIKGKIRGAQKPGTQIVGTVSLKHVYEIAKIKQSEFDAFLEHLSAALKKNKVPAAPAEELVKIVASVKVLIVAKKE